MSDKRKGGAGRKERKSSPVTIGFSDRLSVLIDEKKSAGQSQKDIAASVGVSSGALSEWADDKKTPSIEALEKLSRFFNVSSDYLLGITKDPDIVPSAVDELGLSKATVNTLVEINSSRPRGSIHDYCLRFLDALVLGCSVGALGQHYEEYLECKSAFEKGSEAYEELKYDLPEFISKDDYLNSLRFRKKNAEFQLLFDLSAMFDK